RAGRSDRLAYSPPGSDPDCDGWPRPGPTLGWSNRGHSSGGRDLVRTGGETLAWRRTKHSDDPYRYSGKARRQDRRLDGKGQRRAIPGVIVEEDHSKLSFINRR